MLKERFLYNAYYCEKRSFLYLGYAYKSLICKNVDVSMSLHIMSTSDIQLSYVVSVSV